MGIGSFGLHLPERGDGGLPVERPAGQQRPRRQARRLRYSFQERRCPIPVTAFAEAKGEKGTKTRTWCTPPDQDVFGVVGLWRDAPEWGPTYTMVVTEACIPVADVHDRMPVILKRDNWADWLDGAPD